MFINPSVIQSADTSASDGFQDIELWHPPIYGSTIYAEDIIFLESDGKHGLTRADAVNALVHATWKRERFDVSRVAGAPAPTLWVGPSLDGVTLEVMTYVIAPDDVVIFHCMPLRDKFRRMMEGERR